MMKLEKFDYQIGNKRKKNSYIAIFVCIIALFVGVIIYSSFANFKITESYNIIKGKVNSFTLNAKHVNYFLTDENNILISTNSVPDSTEYTYNSEKSICANGTPIVYDPENNTVAIDAESDFCNIYFDIIPASRRTLTALGETAVKEGTPNYAEYTNVEDGVYAATDDYGTSYYYYGTNRKYVLIDDVLWTIVRINGNGTLRIVNLNESTTSAFNELKNDNSYLGYYYGTALANNHGAAHTNTTPSLMKNTLDLTYANFTNVSYIGDSIFCNDRSTYIENYGLQTGGDTGYGYGAENTYYGAYYRLTNNMPSLSCPNKDDAFTSVDNAKGNAILTNPIGLLSADEVYMTGLVNVAETAFTTMSPWTFIDNEARVYAKKSTGSVEGISVDDSTLLVAPVINLKSGLSYTGTGETTHPYEIVSN